MTPKAPPDKPKPSDSNEPLPSPQSEPVLDSSLDKANGHVNPPQEKDRTFTILSLIGLVLLAVLYLVSGVDVLGIFTTPTPSATIASPRPMITATPTESADWWEVYFTNPNRINDPNHLEGSIPEKLIEYIGQAEKSIHIAAFEFNLTPVAEALIEAHQRGVEVKWFTDDEHGIEADEDPGHGQFAMLRNAGIEVRDDARGGLMHNKFWIFDDKIVWTGSTNITINDNFRNNNNVVVIKSPLLAQIFEREFQELWAGSSGSTSHSTVYRQSLPIENSVIQVLFGAEDEVINHLIPIVQSAKKSIYFMAFSFTHEELGDVLLQRSKVGVEVKGIFETRGSETEFSALPKLFCAGLQVRQDGNKGTFHHKVIIIDNEVVITGSLNFSGNADQVNDENTLAILNPAIAKLFLQEFERRWAEAIIPDPENMNCQ